METNQAENWRKEVRELSYKDLLDELQRPTHDWKQDVMREALYRLLKQTTK